jgi:ribonuclease P/MRP protein subunit RPP40
LADWSDKWLLRFNPEKCKIMHIGHELDTHYFMKGPTGLTELLMIKEEKDLGVFVRSDLKASNHCIKSAAKARRIIGMVRRNFRRLDKEDFLLLYKTYIRPHIEYCVQAWSPYLVKDIDTLERVQKAATNLVPSLKKFNYQERLNILGLTTLQLRRTRGDMIETYKLITKKEKIDFNQFFKLATNDHYLGGHSKKIEKTRSRLDVRKNFFSQRIVNDWNKLPQHVVDAPNVNTFKNLIDRHAEDMSNRSRYA